MTRYLGHNGGIPLAYRNHTGQLASFNGGCVKKCETILVLHVAETGPLMGHQFVPERHLNPINLVFQNLTPNINQRKLKFGETKNSINYLKFGLKFFRRHPITLQSIHIFKIIVNRNNL